MGYDRLGPSGSATNTNQKDPATSLPELQKRTKKTKLILFTLAVLVVAVVCLGIFAGIRAVAKPNTRTSASTRFSTFREL
ncbi:BnaC09g29670D [Brassica napus]|uniref:BnaC09g29670D protein n=1 Tax=Brassica napus TaxID=3708 RepID=A0A078HB73_BRANA|nr:BnaC09g29670D [Brassica napus]